MAHSSADRDGGIELDYVSFFYYRFKLSVLINTNCNVGRFEGEEMARNGNVFSAPLCLLGSARSRLRYCLLLGSCVAVSSISETFNLLFVLSPAACRGYTEFTFIADDLFDSASPLFPLFLVLSAPDYFDQNKRRNYRRYVAEPAGETVLCVKAVNVLGDLCLCKDWLHFWVMFWYSQFQCLRGEEFGMSHRGTVASEQIAHELRLNMRVYVTLIELSNLKL